MSFFSQPQKNLVAMVTKIVKMLHQVGTYLLQATPVLVLYALLSSADFSRLTFSKTSFRNTLRVSIGLETFCGS